MATKLDNECCRNEENVKINVDYELGKSSWRKMNMALEDGKQKEGVAYLSKGMEEKLWVIDDAVWDQFEDVK